jgi:predicted Zn-dependent peptidase
MKISVNIVVPLSIETASENALVGGLLVRSCKKYPDFTVLSKKLSSLYGADLTSSLSKLGESQVLKISVSGLDDRYSLDDVSIAKELSELLCSVIFEPNVKDNAFIESELEQERRQLLDVIDSEFNEKRIYAMEQLIKHMCKDEVYGTAEKIKAATAESLYRAWQNLLKTAKFEILYIGDSPADKAKEVFTKAFANIERNVAASSTDVVKNVSKEKHITEEMELSQSKLVMGFRTQISAGDDEAVAERLMCAVLGGTASSKLFNNVREKQSLCYYCSSAYDSIKGIMYINSGVEGENLEKAEKAILKEIEDMKNGEITDFEIEATKLAVVNSFKSSSDSVSGIENWYTGRIFNGDLETVEEVSAEVNAVTKEQIVNAANKLLLDTVYVLKNK